MALTEQRKASWKLIGPGIVVAATGVGTGDLVATLMAGERFGYTLLWATIIGCLVKISLAEATGRWHLATGRTIFDGWTDIGRWTHVYFAPYIVIWGFVYGATAMSATALPLNALFPVLPVWGWAMIVGVAGLLFVWFNNYAVFEKVMTVLVGLMFVTVVGLAIVVTPNLGEVLTGLVPTLPEGSTFYTLSLLGGVGGTITMAAYGYWVNAKGWRDATWMRVMRWDNRVAYVMTGLFVIATLIVGAELLYSSNIALNEGDRGLLDLSVVLEDRFGRTVSVVFLVGFFAAAFTSVLGVWHGVSLLFADFVGHLRGKVNRPVEERERSWEFRAYLLWLTFPPMLLLLLGKPFQLVIVYGVLGSFFMPFLALTLLWLLNSSRTPREWRNGWVSNVGLVIAGLLFIVLCANELWSTVQGG
ncbi:Nramp family divalent metal transporter [Marinactinospora thermotolerans]|uniref:Mn2+ and Fe2+ transporters of the NRAMP family n=1 Tax=Marinactinospora thermotolerans DSM 45154 TaxID=1122192 RepID=A0A1T4Q557_9ACTN|nr:Nramp family divalent metal transporter [Marinactinospora thermotolerans]SJZ98806.1 Mn2+ and Fe2+ transporters of the NRAMP family [Marinactinospora thermotolerans DSM 45154]